MFKFTIDTSSAAFDADPGYELVRVARQVSAAFYIDGTSGVILDSNGNRVGKWSYVDESSARVASADEAAPVTMALYAVMRDDGWTEEDAARDADSITYDMHTQGMSLVESLRAHFETRSDEPEAHALDIGRRVIARLDEQADEQAD